MKALVALALVPGVAAASGLSAPFVGTSESSPVHADPAAVHWNPAMLVELGREFMPSVGGGVIDVRYSRERRGRYQFADSLRFDAPVSEGDLDPDRTGASGSVAATQPLPLGSAFIAWPVHPDVVLGAGLFVPFAAVLAFPEDGPQRFALRSVTMSAVEMGPAVGWRVHPQLSLGAGASFVLGFAELTRTADLAGTPLLRQTFADPPISQPNDFGPDAPSEVRELDTLARPFTFGPGVGYSWAARVGAAYEPDPQVRLGATYIHRGPLTLEGPFELDLDDPLFTEDLAPQGLRYPAKVNGRAELDFPLPSSLHLGARWEANERLVLATTLGWYRYSMVESLDLRLRSHELEQPELGLGPTAAISVPRDWNDSVTVDVRASLQFDEAWRLGALLGYHSPVSPDETLDVSSPDGHRLVAALLGGWDLGRVEWLASRVELQGDLQLQYVVPRETRTSDMDLANGTYDLLLLTGVVGVRVRF